MARNKKPTYLDLIKAGWTDMGAHASPAASTHYAELNGAPTTVTQVPIPARGTGEKALAEARAREAQKPAATPIRPALAAVPPPAPAKPTAEELATRAWDAFSVRVNSKAVGGLGITATSTAEAAGRIYADCIDAEGAHCGSIRRNLNAFIRESVSLGDLEAIMSAAIPDGYNGFNANQLRDYAKYFGDGARYFIAREGSVAIYVKPFDRVWINGDALSGLADEVSFEFDVGMFRLWWD